MNSSTGNQRFQSHWSRLKEYSRRSPRSFIVVPVLMAIGGMVGFSNITISPDQDTLRIFLSGLAGTQASLIAIVFAVTILAIQLTADRYTMRIGPIFYRHPVFQLTLVGFLLSIVFDLGLLFNLGFSGAPNYQAGLYAAVGMAVGNIWMFITYIKTSIHLNTPEGVIGVVADEISPARFFSRLQKSNEGSTPPHPLIPLYSIIRNALENEEIETATTAIHQYATVTNRALTFGVQNGLLGNHSAGDHMSTVDSIFKRQLTNLVIRAHDLEESTLVNTIISLYGELAEIGLRHDEFNIVHRAFRGLVELSRIEAPIDVDHYQIHYAVWDQLGNLLVTAANTSPPNILDSLLVNMRSLVNRHLTYEYEYNMHPEILLEYIRDLEAVHSSLIEQYQHEISSSTFDWYEGYDTGEEPKSVIALYRWRKHWFDISGKLLQKVDPDERYPVMEGSYRDMWKKICIEAIEGGLTDYGQTLCEALIELAYIEPLESGNRYTRWDSILARVMLDGEKEVVDDAFEKILDYEKLDWEDSDDSDMPVPLVIGSEEWEMRYPNRLDTRFGALNAHSQFPQRLEDIRQEVVEIHEELLEEAAE